MTVQKPDGSNRVCVDFRKLNKVTMFDPKPIPQPEQIFASWQRTYTFPLLTSPRAIGRFNALAVPCVNWSTSCQCLDINYGIKGGLQNTVLSKKENDVSSFL